VGDSVTSLLKEFMELRERVDRLEAGNKAQKEENSAQKEKIKELEAKVAKLQRMEDRLDLLDMKLKERSLIIHGLQTHQPNANPQQLVESLFQDDLGITPRIVRTSFVGQRLEDRSVPVQVELGSVSAKFAVFKQCIKLADKPHISIKEDLPAGIRLKRSQLYEVYKKSKADGKKVMFRGATLFIDGAPYTGQPQTQACQRTFSNPAQTTTN
jgi:hypothetical protein